LLPVSVKVVQTWLYFSVSAAGYLGYFGNFDCLDFVSVFEFNLAIIFCVVLKFVEQKIRTVMATAAASCLPVSGRVLRSTVSLPANVLGCGQPQHIWLDDNPRYQMRRFWKGLE